jgi:rhodanese-related sulfurtransferase
MVSEITARELADKLKSPTPPLVIDVREPHEYAYAHIEGAQLKPLGQIATWASDFDKNAEIVLQCHSGSRSMYAAQFLQRLGFKHVANLKGGIDSWSIQVDPTVPRY